MPIHLYAKLDLPAGIILESMAKIVFKNGLFERVDIFPVENKPGLDELDNNRVKLLIVNNLDDIIKRWIDHFIYNKPIIEEIITKRIEDAPFS